MANWTTLKAAIANVIKTNGNQEIVGQVLQNVLTNIVNSVGENATFAGVATPTTNPGAPDGPVFYLATEGTYTNFSGFIVKPGQIGVFKWNGAVWANQAIDVLQVATSLDNPSDVTFPTSKAIADEFNYSKNLLNRAEAIDGFVDSNNGRILTNPTVFPFAKCSPVIKVTPGVTYIISGRTDVKGIVGYTENGNRVKIYDDTWALPSYNDSFTIPENVVAIQFSLVLHHEYSNADKIQLEIGDVATEYSEYKAQNLKVAVAANANKIAASTSYMAAISSLLLNSYYFPDYKEAPGTVDGNFAFWQGFSTKSDALSNGVVKAVVFSSAATSRINFKFRLSKKVIDENGNITGLETITPEYNLFLDAGNNRVELNVPLLFEKDYVAEYYFISNVKSAINYKSGAADGKVWVRYNDQVPTKGSMWDVGVEIAYIDTDIPKKTLKVLSVGNSYAEDAFSYVPFIFRDCCKDIELTFGILYYGGASLAQHYEFFTNGNKVYAYRKISPSDDVWTSTNSVSITDAVNDDEWDIIIFQQNGANAGNYETFQPYLNDLIKGINQVVKKPVKFGWHMVEPYSTDLETSKSQFAAFAQAAKDVYNKTLVDVIFPSATGLQNARTTSLQSYGDGGNLMHTSIHAQEGISCYCLALPNVIKLLELCGMNYNGIYGDSNVPTQSWINSRAIPNQNGSSVGATQDNCNIAQACAIFAAKKPFEITNINTLGYDINA